MRWSMNLAVTAFVLGTGFWAGQAEAGPNYWLFESGQVRPLALAEHRKLLFAVNTPDNRLEVYRTMPWGLVHIGSASVGLEPVAVAVRNDREVWVVNNLSDSVSIVDVTVATQPRVMRTLQVGDEPRDIVFAGHNKDRAFITTAHRGQDAPYDPQLTTPSVGRADVWVYDANNLGSGLVGTPLNIVQLFTDSPRALAVSPDGSTVYAAGMSTGNETTSVNEFILGQIEGQIGQPILPPPTTNYQGIPMPPTGLIVRWNGEHWVDELEREWDPFIMFSLPDKDVFVINANANPPSLVPGPTGFFPHVGTTLLNMVVNPVNGKVYVTNMESSNEQRFEGPGDFAGHTVRGKHNQQRITVLGPNEVSPRHLNKHVDYDTCCDAAPNAESVLSMAMPMGMEISRDGKKLFVAAMGSSKVGIYNTAALENDSFYPNANDQIKVSGGGPTGMALDESSNRLYVLTRFDNAISIIDIKKRKEIDHVAMPNPEPESVRRGRRFLYDATISSKGDSFCGSCHVFGDKDELAWDLGDPDGDILDNQNPMNVALPIPFTAGMDPDFITHKGPMATQSLRGMANHGPMHWRGDRTGALEAPSIQPNSGAYDERAAFKKFAPAFEGLLGRDEPLGDADMEAFTSFILQLAYPPNPIRNLDNSLTAQQEEGRDFFFNSISDSNVISCQGCHILDPEANAQFGEALPGFFGTDGRSASEVFPQVFKVPHLRNVYTKVGKFGFFNLAPFIETTQDQEGFMGEQIRGWGTNRGGDFDGIFRFMHATTFSQGFLFGPNPGGIPVGPTGDPMRRAVEAFILAFDSNLKPIVGQQVTLVHGSSASEEARAALLVQRADAGDCDLVAKGHSLVGERGFLYVGGGRFMSDRRRDGTVSQAAMRIRYSTRPASLTLTCVPPGSGYRIAIDRDNDGVLDGDDC